MKSLKLDMQIRPTQGFVLGSGLHVDKRYFRGSEEELSKDFSTNTGLSLDQEVRLKRKRVLSATAVPKEVLRLQRD